MKIATTTQMKQIDAAAIDKFGIPSLTLMEHAAGKLTDTILCILSGISNPKVCIYCGMGNNGGDGLACARQLISGGVDVMVYMVGNPDKQTADSKVNMKLLASTGCDINMFYGQAVPCCNLIVDALFGFGLNREVTGIYREAIEQINDSPAAVISCDIPSGINGDTGLPMGTAIRSDYTICFTCAKTGLLKKEAQPYVGQLRVVDIGIPDILLSNLPQSE